jgi:hypothetical protein
MTVRCIDREHRPIGWFQIQTFDLTTQHRDLVAKDQDVDLFRLLAACPARSLQHLTQDQVSERQEHAGQPAS